MITFKQLGLSENVLKAVGDMGFEKTTPIQEQAIPQIMQGRDIIGQASTGTGKTAAFAIPVVEKINPELKKAQALILCPTRELAIQVSREIEKLLKYKKGVRSVAIYGGQHIQRQFYALDFGPQIIIGTPGRTLDHIHRGSLNLANVKMMVLDEADEMLDMGFRQDIEQILKSILNVEQTVLFSATMSREVMRLAKRYQKDAKIIKVVGKEAGIKAIKQCYFDVEPTGKVALLIQLLRNYNPYCTIVFCNTKRKVDKVARELRGRGFLASGIHGDIRQNKRDMIMSKFRSGKLQVLVATDVAARGIDVSNVEIVFNFEIPKDTESYVHRIGRTGRAGKTGNAFSLVSRGEFGQLRSIIRYTRSNISKGQLTVLNQTEPVKPKTSQPVKSKKAQPEKLSNNTQSSTQLENRAGKILQSLKSRMNKDEVSAYASIMNKFVCDRYTTNDFAAGLLKIVVEVEQQKTRQSRGY